MAIQYLAEAETKKLIQEKETIVVSFGTDWCGSCKMIAPILEEISQNFPVVKVDADAHPTYAAEMSVANLPTTFIFKKGKQVKSIVGFVPKEIITQEL